MKRIVMIGAVLVSLSAPGARAEGNEAPAPADKPKLEKPGRHANPPLQEMTVTGVIQKFDRKKLDGTAAVSGFKLVTSDGAEVRLPAPGKGKDAPAVNLEELVGVTVKVTGMGLEMERDGKKRCMLRTLKSVEKTPPPDAPKP